MIPFILGFILGELTGVSIMCILQVSRKEDE